MSQSRFSLVPVSVWWWVVLLVGGAFLSLFQVVSLRPVKAFVGWQHPTLTTLKTARPVLQHQPEPTSQRGVFAPEGLLADDGFQPNPNSAVNVIAVQADGKILVGGFFSTIVGQTRNRIARLNADGTLDTAFNPNSSGVVSTIAVQPDGKILVGGSFNTIGGQFHFGIARLNPDGTADSAFNPNTNGTVNIIAVQPDGKILVGGPFTAIAGQPRNRLARLNADGTLDTLFDPNANNQVLTIVVQPDGRTLVGGSFTTIGGQTRNRIARLNADGTLDTGFNPNANNQVSTIAMQVDGKILVGGPFAVIGGQTRNRIARLNPDGTLDTLFDPNASTVASTINTITVQVDGKILVGGTFTTIGGQTRNRLARLNFDGTLDPVFDPNVGNTVQTVAVQSDGKILVGGSFASLGPVSFSNLGRLYFNGIPEVPSSAMNADSSVLAVALQPDGKIVAGGNFTIIGGQARNRLARLNSDGTADTFNPSPNGAITTIVVQPDGKILVAGSFTTIAGQGRSVIARLNADGTLDPTFNPGPNTQITTLTIQPDGKILAGGGFTSIGGQARNRIARLNPDGTADLAFNPNANNVVNTIALQPDGKILVGGIFTNIGGQTRNNMARLNADGTVDLTFNPNVDNTVSVIALQTDGKILLGGQFTAVGGQSRSRLARLNADGTLQNIAMDANSTVNAIVLQADGKILVGGTFSTLGGQNRPAFARLNPDGTPDSFNPGNSGSVNTLAVQPDGKVVVGGSFTAIGGQSRSNLTQLANDTASLQNLAVDAVGTTLTWMRSGSNAEAGFVTFEQSTDGVTFTPLGSGTRITGGWQLTGLSFPLQQIFYVRARGFSDSTQGNHGGNILESVRQVFLPVTVNSIARSGAAQVCNSASVSWNVSLSSSVTGLTLSNFALVSSGLTGPSLTGISGSGAAYTVTATVGTGSGTLALNLANASGVTPVISYLPFAGEAFTVLAPPTATAGGPFSLCANSILAGLGGNTPGVGETGAWSIVTPGITGVFFGANTPNAAFQHTGGTTSPFTLRWTVTNTNVGCTNFTDVTVNLVASASITPGGPTTFCTPGSVTLTANPGGATYLWSTGETTQAITVSASGTYSCQVNAGSCLLNPTPVTVTANLAPSVTARSNSPVLLNGPMELYATPGVPGTYSYSWAGPGGYSSTQQNPIRLGATQAMSGTYTVTITNTGTGCTSQASTQVAVGANSLIGLSVTGTPYTGSTPPTNPLDTSYGTSTIQTLMTNTSSQTLQAPMYWIIRQLVKVPDVPNDPRPYYVDSRDAGTPAGGNARQTVAGPLAPGNSVPVDFRIAVDQTNKVPFQFYIDFYAATNTSPVAKPVGSFFLKVDGTGVQGSGFKVEGTEERIQGSGFRVQGDEETAQSSVLSPQSFISGAGLQAGVRTAVDPKAPRRMAVVANDYATGNVVVKYSEDAVSWRQLNLSRTVGGKTYQTAFEPAAGYDQNGNLLVVYALADVDNNSSAIVLSQKLNDRLAFSPPVALETHGAAEFVSVGRPVLAISGGRPFVAWEDQTQAGIERHIRLYDLAAHRLVEIASGKVSHPTLTVTANGSLVVGWNDWASSRLLCRTGADSNSFGAPVVVANTSMGYGQKITAMADVAATPNMTIVADPARPGPLFATFADFTTSLDVFLTRSTDNGQTWSTPQPVSSTTAGDQFLPCLAVDSVGFVTIGFYDTRHDQTGETAHVYARRSRDGGNTFEAEIQVSDTASNTSASNPRRTWAANYGEQMGVISRGKEGVFVVWTDTRNGSEDIFLK
ncbi:MAG: hypothetical protein K1Y36_27855 [Blastocatellia bacterium]|nr:hypothetical protein [Blastocatellia bacterium]